MTVGLLLLLRVAMAQDLDAQRARFEDLYGQLQQAEDEGDAAMRDEALLAMDHLVVELQQDSSDDADALRAKILTQTGAARCRSDDPTLGAQDLREALELTSNPERKKRLFRELGECPAPADPAVRAEPVDAYQDDWSGPAPSIGNWYDEEDDEDWVNEYREPSHTNRAYTSPQPAERLDPLPGRPAQIGGGVLAAVGAIAVLGTWQTYQINPVMSSDAWLGLQVGNTVGWLGVVGGGALVISGTAKNMTVTVGPPLAVPR